MTTSKPYLILLLSAFIQCIVPTWVNGDIIATSGDVQVVDAPASVQRDDYTSNNFARVFVERQQLAVQTVLINAVNPGRYDAYADFEDQTFINPVLFDSYFLHFDPIGAEGFVDGIITFSRPMLGVIGRSLTMQQTDNTLGAIGTLYPTNRFDREPEYQPRGNYDYFELSQDMKTLSFRLRATDIDQLRIVVRSIPEPASFAFVIGAIGWGMTRRRRTHA
jgi:hypothetical protein